MKEADWLLRHYGFTPPELPYDAAGDLPLHIDPKLAWALAHPERFPIELNTADQELLLRVPGLGPLSIRRIMRLRREGRFRDPAQLKGLGGAAGPRAGFCDIRRALLWARSAARARHYAPRGPLVEQLTLW